MAKAPPQPSGSKPSPVPQQQPKKRAAAFEIDDIFNAKKSKQATAPPPPAPAAEPAAAAAGKKKKNKGKGKVSSSPSELDADPDAMDLEEDAEMSSIGAAILQAKKEAKRVPQTIVDSSSSIEAYRPALPTLGKRKAGAGGPGDEAEERFMDSRGTSEFSLFFVRVGRVKLKFEP